MKMKLIFIILIFMLFFIKPILASEFCNGFERGYIAGYKQSSGSAYDPYAPYCPFQPYKTASDPKSDYEHGYTIGYREGMSEGR
jgi:hypothetical protein